MGWDHKRNGPATGYFYVSRRVPGKPHPVKVYLGRGEAAHAAAAELARRRLGRREAKRLLREAASPATEGDRLATELRAWADVLLRGWLILAGHHRHHGQWRANRG